MRMAQSDYYHHAMGCQPVLLADDVLGELDKVKRENFWAACPRSTQLIASGTELPESHEDWRVYNLHCGMIREK